jgi:hypothetical protein
MATTRFPQSIFPDFPHEQTVVEKDGGLTSAWNLSLSSLYQALQKNFKNEGIVFPPLTADQIATIQALYTPYIGQPLPSTLPDISGQTVFDSTNRVPKQFIITFDGAVPPNVMTAAWLTFTLT